MDSLIVVKCQICGREFSSYKALSSHIRMHKLSSKQCYDKYLKKENEGLCLICTNKTSFISLKDGYRLFCSSKCSYLDPKVQEKTKNFFLKKYGYTHPRKDPIYLKDLSEKYYERTGYTNPSQNPETKRKVKQTYHSKTGYTNPSKDPIVKCKKKNTYRNNYFSEIKKNFQKNNVKLMDSEYTNAHCIHTWKCTKCNHHIFKQRWNDIQQGYKCSKCHPRNHGQSHGETDLGDWIESIGFSIIRKDRSIIGREIDIYIPNLKVGIEYDGLYWHSEECKENYYPDSKEDPKIKQLIKTELCTEKGIQLIHIFEDEWILYKSKIKELLQKILLEDYDLLDNDFSMITLNRRFSKNPKYYQNLGYEVTIMEPRLYPNKDGFKVWDVGYLQLITCKKRKGCYEN